MFARDVHGTTSGIQGHDFDFSLMYLSGLTFSTSKPPRDVFSLRDVLYDVPQITFADPASLAPASDKDNAPQYLSFLEISSVPVLDSLDNLIYSFPWIQASGTVSPGKGTLVGSSRGWRRPDETPELVEYLFGAGNTLRMPLFWQVAVVWAHSTNKVDYDFKLANLDFKARNETGEARRDVDDQGASIVGVMRTACASKTAPTSMSTTPATGSLGALTGTAGESTAGSGTGGAESPPSSTPSIASYRSAVPETWLAVSHMSDLIGESTNHINVSSATGSAVIVSRCQRGLTQRSAVQGIAILRWPFAHGVKRRIVV
ncbi:hypothetical protein PG984_003919 [Apiospora sp. TS-2023a]